MTGPAPTDRPRPQQRPDHLPQQLPQPEPGRTAGPNVLVVVLDDLGFAQLGCYGSDIATPNIDALANGGLRYNRFHVTALCSPTRAAILTGRNHHAVGMGMLPELAVRYPGYTGRIPRTAATFARHLRDSGYSTYAVGKWHLAPRDEWSASGPFDRWPLGLGFERFYGFLGGDTNQWTPELKVDNHAIEPPRGPDEGYHLTEDLADQAIRMLQDQQQATPGKPFFMWFATGAMHAPHQVPREWIEQYAGRFDGGWDAWRERVFAAQIANGTVPPDTVLTERPSWVAAWDRLPAEQQRLYARMMEVYAGFLTHTDYQIGRLVEHVRDLGLLDDTLILLLSDNGTSAEGGPYGSVNEHRFVHGLDEDLDENLARIDELGGRRAYNHYAWGWAWAGNTPLRLWKRYAWLGGVRTPLIVHWPMGVAARGEVRDQFCHAVDLMPTILDSAGITQPSSVDGIEQQPVDGASILDTFRDAAAPSPRETQYFEMLGSRAIFHQGWKATTDHVGGQLAVERDNIEGSREFETDNWLLFDLAHDFSEACDASAAEPDRLQRMIDRWWQEAERNHVLPLDDSFIGRAVAMYRPAYGPRHRTVFKPGGGPVSEDVLPPLGMGYVVTARVDVPDHADGIVFALGNWTNGCALYLRDGRLVHVFNSFGTVHVITADDVVEAGRHELSYRYSRDGGGRAGILCVDGREVGRGELPHDLPFRWQIGSAGLTIGRDRGFPVCDDYTPPFEFTGTLHDVTFEVPMLAPKDDTAARAELGIALKSE
jgi:arylsulfatase A-like enzyme